MAHKTSGHARNVKRKIFAEFHCKSSSAKYFPMLRRPYFFCLYKRNRGKKIHLRGRAFHKAALPLKNPPPPKMGRLPGLAVGQGATRPLPLPNVPVQALLPRIAAANVRRGRGAKGAARERRQWRSKRPQRLGSRLHLRKQRAAQVPSGNPDSACLCGSKVLAPPLWVVFLPTSFGP